MQKNRENKTKNRRDQSRGWVEALQFIRNLPIYREWRRDVFIKNKFICQSCGQRGGKIEAHHIKPFTGLVREAIELMPELSIVSAAGIYAPLWDIDNGITLCITCHGKLRRRNPKQPPRLRKGLSRIL